MIDGINMKFFKNASNKNMLKSQKFGVCSICLFWDIKKFCNHPFGSTEKYDFLLLIFFFIIQIIFSINRKPFRKSLISFYKQRMVPSHVRCMFHISTSFSNAGLFNRTTLSFLFIILFDSYLTSDEGSAFNPIRLDL